MKKMMPIGPLMIEHRLIERMIGVMEKEAARIDREKAADPLFIDTVVDFIRTYADRCHHGKEEDILFRELTKKNLDAVHRRVMEELIAEHVLGREKTKSLSLAGKRYAGGDRAALTDITRLMKELAGFYPAHIIKEDKSDLELLLGLKNAFFEGMQSIVANESGSRSPRFSGAVKNLIAVPLSLGQTISQTAGIAYARRMKALDEGEHVLEIFLRYSGVERHLFWRRLQKSVVVDVAND